MADAHSTAHSPGSPSTSGSPGSLANPDDIDIEALGPPRGTLAIVTIFGVLFAVAWIAMYVFEFMGRGAPHSH